MQPKTSFSKDKSSLNACRRVKSCSCGGNDSKNLLNRNLPSWIIFKTCRLVNPRATVTPTSLRVDFTRL